LSTSAESTSQSSSGVGRYVGTGSQADLEVAFDPDLDREVLLERADAADVAALRRKARALAVVVHPAVTRVHDVVLAADGTARVVVERPVGVPIEGWCASRPSLARRLAVLHAIGEGLEAAHRADVVHGALTAEAILVGDRDAPRITGFLRTATGGSTDGDRRAFCRLAQALIADDLRLRRRPRYRALVSALRQGVATTAGPSLSVVVARIAACRSSGLRWELTVGVVAIAAVAWAAARPDPTASSWCDEVERVLADVWNPSVRAELNEAMRATGVEYADATARTVLADLDLFADRWRELQVGRCSAGATDSGVSVCLYRKFDGLRVVVGALKTADATSIANAVDAVAALGSPDECTASGVAVLAITADAAATDEIRADLVAADTLRELGRYADARDAAERAVEGATRMGSDASLAEAQLLLAQALFALGEEAAAERELHEAFTTGLSAGHDAVVARAAAELTYTLARRGALDDAELWRDHAIAAGARTADPRLRARVAAVSARVSFERSDYRTAKTAYERAVELAEQTEPRDLAAVLHARQSLAITHGRLGDHERALELLERNADETAQRYGVSHPDYGRQTNSVATELRALGRTRDATTMRRRAVDVLTKTIGKTHSDTLAARASLATDLSGEGDDEQALVMMQELVVDAEAQLGADDPRTIGHIAELGLAESMLQRYDDAIVHLRDAATRGEARLGEEHAEVLGVLSNLAATSMFAGHHEEAAEIFERVITRTERVLGGEHPQLVPALLGASRSKRELGDLDGAIAMLERAQAIMAKHVERPDRTARVAFDLAQLLWGRPPDRARAVELARGAHQQFALAAGQGLASGTDSAAEVTQWLAEHRVP
jgi:tetratricopeptide (TPR) repeat protein